MITNLSSQEIPMEFYEFKFNKILYDAGHNWEKNTTFGPIRYQSTNDSIMILQDSLRMHALLGINSKNDNIRMYGYERFSYKKHFYGYLYASIVNDPNQFLRYSGIPRDISRLGFKSGEMELSGIGYQNDWLLFQFGRGRQSWGAGNDIQLALSENSPAYDYGLFGLNFGKLRFRYFHGFLESDSSEINRYITARGFEWTNLGSIVISLSESVIYSGENRPIDLSYMNPLSTHLEIELNNRQNRLGTNDANGVWMLSLDWMLKPQLRFSGNILFDEFVLDKIEKDAGKENGIAYSGRLSYCTIRTKNVTLTTYLSLLTVGTPTFRHHNGSNNFVQRNKPLGWEFGSDGREFIIGMNYYNMRNLISNFEIGFREIGEENLNHNPYNTYSDYISGTYPSGIIKRTSYVSSEIQWWIKPNISVITGIDWSSSNTVGNKFEFNIGIDIFIPYNF